MLRAVFRAFALTMVVLLTGIGALSGAPRSLAASQPITVPVDVHDMAVAPAQTVFRVGQTYRFLVTNSGKATHELVIEPAGAIDQALTASGTTAEAEEIAPGQSKELLWTFTTPGQYQLACHQPGHFEAGMVHQIQVTDKAVAVPVTLGDMTVSMNQTDLKPNTLYTFVISNTGKATHEVVAEQAGKVDQALEGSNEPEEAAEAEDIAPGTVRELPWFFTTDGQYQLACHKPGHFEAGMVEQFTVA
jgi:uncharacterized cupredoxin-like copper-binding protein